MAPFLILGMLYDRITLSRELTTHQLVIAVCGNWLDSTSTALPMSSCNMPCSGNSAELCGGGNALLVFYSGVDPGPPPGTWSQVGCFS
jgi:hypothetical protein